MSAVTSPDFRLYQIFQKEIVDVFLKKSAKVKFNGIIKRKGFHQKYRFFGWQSLMYPLSNNELIKEDKRILTKISI
jgi:hypothetical protein